MTTSSNNSALEKTSDLHVVETRPLIPPSRLHNDIPLDHASANTVSKTRRSIQNILHHNDQKLLIIMMQNILYRSSCFRYCISRGVI